MQREDLGSVCFSARLQSSMANPPRNGPVEPTCKAHPGQRPMERGRGPPRQGHRAVACTGAGRPMTATTHRCGMEPPQAGQERGNRHHQHPSWPLCPVTTGGRPPDPARKQKQLRTRPGCGGRDNFCCKLDPHVWTNKNNRGSVCSIMYTTTSTDMSATDYMTCVYGQ